MNMVGWYLAIDKCGENVSRETLDKEDVEMAVRQYIGARYVPKYFENPDGSNDWLEGVTYEPLTIVTYAGNIFTSKIPVPANTPSPNQSPKYWVNTGTGGGGGSEINEIKQEINEINQEITNITSDIEDINKDIANITKNKSYLFMADSYGDYTYNSKNFMQLLAEYCGITNYKIKYEGGASFAPNTEHKTFLQLLQEYKAENPDDTFTDIYVFAGANDQMQTDSNVTQGIQGFITYVNENYTGAKVHLGVVSKIILSSNISRVGNLVNNYKQIEIMGGEYINNSEYIMTKNTEFINDFIHPTSQSVQMIAQYLVGGVINGCCHIYKSFNVNATINPAFTNLTGGRITNSTLKQTQVDGVVNFNGNVALLFNEPSSSSSFNLGTVLLIDSCIMGNSVSNYPLSTYGGVIIGNDYNMQLISGNVSGVTTTNPRCVLGFNVKTLTSGAYTDFRLGLMGSYTIL